MIKNKLINSLNLKYKKSHLSTAKGNESRGLLNKLKKYDDGDHNLILKEISKDFWNSYEAFIFDEKRLVFILFVSKRKQLFNKKFISACVNIFELLDDRSTWSFRLIEVDSQGSESEIDILNWYLGDRFKIEKKNNKLN
jgi:hypothetical protein